MIKRPGRIVVGVYVIAFMALGGPISHGDRALGLAFILTALTMGDVRFSAVSTDR